MAVIIAGDRSGVGKTTITLALLSFLSQQGDRVQSFKVGPDYIDPMFHTAVTGLPCRNLDPVLTSESYVQDCFNRHSQGVGWVIVEGVMGLFDGIRNLGTEQQVTSLNDYASTAHIARLLNLPVVLVLDCRSLSSSIAAIASGYANLDPRVKIAGVILNQVGSDRHLELLRDALKTINLPIFGVLRRNAVVTIPDRHLGLVPSEELAQLKNIFSELAHIAKTCFNWEHLFPLLKYQSPPVSPASSSSQSSSSPIKIAVARDKAFNFYYQDNLDILTELGAELIFWSPLTAETLPSNIQGLYFGGGFPEVFAEQLAENKIILQQLRQIIQSGIPTYAECGGLMYLCQQIVDLNAKTWSMAGIIAATAVMEKKITLGYRQATALTSSPLIAAKQTVRGHEFHKSQLTDFSPTPIWQMQGFHSSSHQFSEGWQIAQLHASYLHLHFGEYKFLPQRFIQRCLNYKI
jgi:cobyrinic acid a,c-diamide synthase